MQGQPVWTDRETCRVCGGTDLARVASFGHTPLSDKLRKLPDSEAPAPRVPLELMHCADCGLSQLSVDVSPRVLYAEDYPYYSSISPALSEHFAKSAARIIGERGIGPGDLVVEAASNDGCLLRHFAAAGARAIGYDPAAGPTATARTFGIDARCSFFTDEAATDLIAEAGQAQVVLANNVLAHVPDLRGFVRGISRVLASDGMAVIEVPYMVDMVDQREFDTIYHQHLCYFHVSALSRLFGDASLRIADVERLTIHGGSLRLFVEHGQGDGPKATAMIADEHRAGHTGSAFIGRIGNAANTVRDRLAALLDTAQAEGSSVRAYAAAGKATTMLAWCGLDVDQLGFVADLNPHKHDLYMPGTDLQIVPPARLRALRPDVVVILAWNFADEIVAQLDDLRQTGTRFLVPVPDPRFIQ